MSRAEGRNPLALHSTEISISIYISEWVCARSSLCSLFLHSLTQGNTRRELRWGGCGESEDDGLTRRGLQEGFAGSWREGETQIKSCMKNRAGKMHRVRAGEGSRDAAPRVEANAMGPAQTPPVTGVSPPLLWSWPKLAAGDGVT